MKPMDEQLKEVDAILDRKLSSVFIPWAIRHPRYMRSFARLVKPYRRSERARKENAEKGITVPISLIISITPYCNLQCTGCYAIATGTTGPGSTGRTLDINQWRTILRDASDMGVFLFVIAGGEPFLYPGLMDLLREFRDRWFVIVTNGTVIEDQHHKLLKKSANISVVVSLEGSKEMTDARRGEGVYDQAMEALRRLNKAGVMTGISTTITTDNHRYWMDPAHLDPLIDLGIKLGFFIEYIPNSPSTTNPLSACAPDTAREDNDHHLMLTPEQRSEFRARMLEFRKNKSIYNIHSPGDEEFFGGCVSAGRGFAHITPAGDLTPCPVSNIATHNLTTSSLREGLDSELFHRIIESEHLLETDGMPCALFAHPVEVEELAKEVGAYRTDKERP
ncbi:MAG: radical SAM protein [Thermoplasmata archaeon]|nr:MAG: radical SAM protein [Thermoplasmata archaeon]